MNPVVENGIAVFALANYEDNMKSRITKTSSNFKMDSYWYAANDAIFH